ncbi:MAG: hypothetical protein HY705_00200 [Gemmatimonadetes bacterium]|nr:hypothetical protein [Gemmatimonadota bacterium]
MSVGGQLIVHETGEAVEGAVLDFVRTGGVALARDSLRTTTDGEGRFQLSAEASDVGEVVGDLTVQPPAPWLPYRVRGQTFLTSDVRGEGQIIGRWVVDPYVETIAQLERRGDGRLLAGARVIIIRIGGVTTTPDSSDLRAGPDGRIYFEADAAEPGDMLADVVVESAELARSYRLTRAAFVAKYQDLVPQVDAVWRFGPGLQYVGEIRRADISGAVAGATVEFQRTGGIQVTPSLMVSVTNASGRFPFTLSSLDSGEVVGNLTVHPAAPLRDTTFTGIRLQTFESDIQRLLNVWFIAPPQ